MRQSGVSKEVSSLIVNEETFSVFPVLSRSSHIVCTSVHPEMSQEVSSPIINEGGTFSFSPETMISRHLPLITHRIRFSTSAMDPLPAITPRVNLSLLGNSILPGNAERELTPSEDGEGGPQVDDGESEMSELSELGSDIDSGEALHPAQKIPKPPGEPGRPNSGGYSIEDALVSWGKDEFGGVMVSNNTRA